MKTYFVEVGIEETRLFVKEGYETKRAHFIINGKPYLSIYNTCMFSYDCNDIVITPEVSPYLDNLHENLFNGNIEFAGYRHELPELMARLALEVIEYIDDLNYQLVFLWDIDLPSEKLVGRMHPRFREFFKHQNNFKYLASFCYKTLKHAALNFIASHNHNDYLYVDDDHYFTSIVEKGYIQYMSDGRYEESLKDFTEAMKYSLEDDSLTNQQAQKIFQRAQKQYELQQANTLVVEIKDRKINIEVEGIEERYQSGKNRFEKFIKELATFNRNFTCYLDISSPSIYKYSVDIISTHLQIDQIVSNSELFYDYLFGYCLMLIKHHSQHNVFLITKKAKQKNVHTYYDDYFFYVLSWYRDKDLLLKEIPSRAIDELVVKRKAKKIPA